MFCYISGCFKKQLCLSEEKGARGIGAVMSVHAAGAERSVPRYHTYLSQIGSNFAEGSFAPITKFSKKKKKSAPKQPNFSQKTKFEQKPKF